MKVMTIVRLVLHLALLVGVAFLLQILIGNAQFKPGPDSVPRTVNTTLVYVQVSIALGVLLFVASRYNLV